MKTVMDFGRAVRVGSLAAVLLLMAGCQATLMPTPVVFDASGIDPFKLAPASEQQTTSATPPKFRSTLIGGDQMLHQGCDGFDHFFHGS